MKLFILVALGAASVQGQPVGTIGKGACGVFTDQSGMSLPADPGVTQPNGHCKTDPKGYYPHQPTFEACVAQIKNNDCTMAKYITYGAFYKGGRFSESMCAWFSECNFAHLCADPSKDSGPQCPHTKWTTDINFTSIVVAPWIPPPPPAPPPSPDYPCAAEAEAGLARRSTLSHRLRGGESGLPLPETLDWASWKAAFGRNYTHRNPDGHVLDIEARRKAAFHANVARITRHNAEADAGRHSFRLGVNRFSDLTFTEWRAVYLDLRYTARSKHIRRPRAPVHHHRNYSRARAGGIPAQLDWRARGAVTPVKNQGACGSCWSFAATGSAEGAYQIATGSLRALSEQQLIDCSAPEGNQACMGGSPQEAFTYILDNKGLDSEKDYPYRGLQSLCWYAAEERDVATIDKYVRVDSNDPNRAFPYCETQLESAVSLGPVAVAIEADQPAFQSYKSGVFADTKCGTKLDHGVLVVGYTPDYWIVKNSWGTAWGEQGYIRLKRGGSFGKAGICGILSDASYAVKAKGKPALCPPPTRQPKPQLPCHCSDECAKTCQSLGLWCCNGAGGCSCAHSSTCPQCNPTPPKSPYQPCKDDSADCKCGNIPGISGNVCMPACSSSGECPPLGALKTTATPFCGACLLGPKGQLPHVPNACILSCTASRSKNPFAQDGCPAGSSCKLLSNSPAPCDNGSRWPTNALPCQKTNNCGVCTT